MGVLGGRNLLGQVLDFRSGFHTSALLPALPHLRDHIDRFPLQARHTPIWSATTCAPLPDDLTAAREVMTRHLVEPVRFRPMIEAMYEAGARVFAAAGDRKPGGPRRQRLTRARRRGGSAGWYRSS